MNAVTHLEKVITGEVSAVTHLEKVIAGEVSAVTYTEKVITGEATPITHLQRVIAGIESPVTHLEYVWAGRTPEPTEHEYTGAVPVTFNADGTPLIDWIIYGNMQQTGTPSPTTPIQPSECGERTGNLFDDHNIITIAGLGDRYGVVLPPGTYSIYNGTNNIVYDGINDFANRHVACEAHSTATVTLYTDPGTTCGFLMSLNAASQGGVTIVSGSTAPSSYIPYGYKISISSASTTTPVYLGEIESTRRIKKLVLTGEEQWAKPSSETNTFRIALNDYLREFINVPVCTHYTGIVPVTEIARVDDLEVAFLLSSSGNNYFYIRDDRFNNANDFKSYLAAQYAAGTPVTVWYVLATPTTGIVNEPIRKIGNYADTLSMEQAGVNIPTNNGSTTVDVNTTLKPSEVYIKYKGV